MAITTDVDARTVQATRMPGSAAPTAPLGDLTPARHHLEHALAIYTDLQSHKASHILTLLAALIG